MYYVLFYIFFSSHRKVKPPLFYKYDFMHHSKYNKQSTLLWHSCAKKTSCLYLSNTIIEEEQEHAIN